MGEHPCDAVVLHSGGMDSSICLAIAVKEFGADRVVSLGFSYHQRNSTEIEAARHISQHFGVRREEISFPPIPGWNSSSLVNHDLPITHDIGQIPNTFVPGRNGLFLMMAAPFAHRMKARFLYIGVMEREGMNSGYPDCSREYVDCVQEVIRRDYPGDRISIRTPLIQLSKAETLEIADSLGVLEFFLQHTVSCYQGFLHPGCRTCPACKLRNQGIDEFYRMNPSLPRI